MKKFFINPKTTTTLPHANKGCAWGISVQIQASAVIFIMVEKFSRTPYIKRSSNLGILTFY